MKIDYNLSRPWNTNIAAYDLKVVDEGDLRSELFLGDLILVVGGCDFSAPWGWIPLVDFAACITSIVHELESGCGYAEFEFTESDARIRFSRRDTVVAITCTYFGGEGLAEMGELRNAARDFVSNLRSHLIQQYSELASNTIFLSLVSPP